MTLKHLLMAALATAMLAAPGQAQDRMKVGVILPLTGPFTVYGAEG